MTQANDYLHRHPEFKDLIRVLEGEMGIDPYLVEKDYWIMHCLHELQQAGYEFYLKGGTSLSKGYKIIHRFSEDIDIYIVPPANLGVNTNPKVDKPNAVESRKRYYDHLAATLRMADIEVMRDESADDKEYRSGGIRLFYKSLFDHPGQNVKQGILLEVGFDDVRPYAELDISSWAFDKATESGVEVIDNRALKVPCYHPGYTLVEKLQTISTKFRKVEPGKPMEPNFIRHYYDVYYLLQHPEVQAFIGTPEYLAHVEKRFRGGDVRPLSQNEAFLLSDPAARERIKSRYEDFPSLYYKGQVPFEDILKIIDENIGKL